MTTTETVLSTTQLVLSGVLMGIVISAPAGPVNILCIQRTLERGFWGGFAAGLGAVIADGLLAAVAALGVTAIAGVVDSYKLEIQFVGGLILIAFGIKLFTAEPKLQRKKNGTSLAELRRIVDVVPERLRPALRFQIWRILPHAGVIPQTFFFTITNPGAVLGMGAIIASWGVSVGIGNYRDALTLVLAVMGGSVVWWAFLARLIEKLRDRINEGRLRMINRVAGVVLFAFAGLLFLRFAFGVMGHAADAPMPVTFPTKEIRWLGLLGHAI